MKEQIEKRIAELQEQLQKLHELNKQTVNQILRTDGAIIELEALLRGEEQ